ncbi:MAG TPA: hypothetical protein VIG72_11630 [Pontibacter sp.]
MRKLFAGILLLMLVAAVACDSLDEQFTFYLNRERELVIAPNIAAGKPTELAPITILTRADTTFRSHRTRAELVKEITLDKFVLSIKDSSGTDFDFLERVEVFMSADTLAEVRVAYLEDVPANDTTLNFAINLNLTNARVDDFLKGEKYTIRTRAVLRKSVTKDVKVTANARFRAIADPI